MQMASFELDPNVIVATAVAVATALLIALFLFYITFSIKRRRSSKEGNALFGSTRKTVAADGPPSPWLRKLPLQLTQQALVGQSWDLEHDFGNIDDIGRHQRGLSSQESWRSAVDKDLDSRSKDVFKTDEKWKLWFKVQYREGEDALTVDVFQAKRFPVEYSATGKAMRSVFVVIYLLTSSDQDEEQLSSQQQTALYPNNGSPSFDESFSFRLEKGVSELRKSRLRLSLYDIDVSRTRVCLGHTVVALDSLDEDFGAGKPYYFSRDLQQLAAAMDVPSQELLVTLSYHPIKEKLKLAVFQSRNDMAGDAVCLRTNVIVGTRSVKEKRTGWAPTLSELLVKERCNYAFQVPPKCVDACCIKLTLLQKKTNNGGEEQAASRAVLILGPCTFAHGSGTDHWRQMLANSRKPIEMWHRMIPLAEQPSALEAKTTSSAAVKLHTVRLDSDS